MGLEAGMEQAAQLRHVAPLAGLGDSAQNETHGEADPSPTLLPVALSPPHYPHPPKLPQPSADANPAANNRTFVATDATIDLRLVLQCAGVAGGVGGGGGAAAGLERNGLEGSGGREFVLHVHLVRATHLFTRTRTRVCGTREKTLQTDQQRDTSHERGARAKFEDDEDPLLSKTAICLLRLKVTGAQHAAAPEVAAACNTLINAATYNTPNPSFDFKCGFKTCAPRQACLDISIWHAEKLVDADGRLIWDDRSNHASHEQQREQQHAAVQACPHASAGSLAFLRASDIQDFMSRGVTSPAYIGSVQVHLRQLLSHQAQIVESRSFVLVPTLLSKEISAMRVLQACCRQALARARMLQVSRAAGQARPGEAHSRARFQKMAGRHLRVSVIGARDVPLSASSQFTQPCDTIKLSSALGSEAGGILSQPPMFFQLQAVDGNADPACGAEWIGQPGSNLRSGFLSHVMPSSAHLPDARLHQLGKELMEEGWGEGASGWGLMGWGRKAVWNQEATLIFDLPCDCSFLRVSLYEVVASADAAPGHERAHKNVLIGECFVEIPAPDDEGHAGAGSAGGDGCGGGGVVSAGWLPLKQRGSDEMVRGRGLGGTTLTQLHAEIAYLPCSLLPSPRPTAPQPAEGDLETRGKESEASAVVEKRVPEGTNLSADDALKLLQQLQESMAPTFGSTVQGGAEREAVTEAGAGPSLMASRRWSDAGLKNGEVRVGAAGSEAAGWWRTDEGLRSAQQRGTSGIAGELGTGDRRVKRGEESRELLAETSDWSFLGHDAEDGEEEEREGEQVRGDTEGSGCHAEGKREGGDGPEADKSMKDSDTAAPDPAFMRWMKKTDAREAEEAAELREMLASGGRVGGSRSVSRPGSVVFPGDEEWWERERQMEEEEEAIMREIERVKEQVEAKEEEKRQLEREVEEDEYRIAKVSGERALRVQAWVREPCTCKNGGVAAERTQMQIVQARIVIPSCFLPFPTSPVPRLYVSPRCGSGKTKPSPGAACASTRWLCTRKLRPN